MNTSFLNPAAVLERLHLGAVRTEQGPLPPALDAEVRHLDTWSAGRLAYYVDTRGGGRPVVLLHAVDAAASSREMAPLFEALRHERPVYALDLPGFGLSDRAERTYDVALFRSAVRRFLTDVVRAPDGVDVIALSLSSEFAAAVAREDQSLVHSLTLISPTGLRHARNGASALLRAATHVPLVAEGLFRLIGSRPSVRWFLGKSFQGEPDRELVEYSVRTAAAPGARHAPLAFISGDLFTDDAFERLYVPLAVPTLVVYDRDPYTSFERLDELVKRNPHVVAEHIAPTRGLPHFERPWAVVGAIKKFWAQFDTT